MNENLSADVVRQLILPRERMRFYQRVLLVAISALLIFNLLVYYAESLYRAYLFQQQQHIAYQTSQQRLDEVIEDSISRFRGVGKRTYEILDDPGLIQHLLDINESSKTQILDIVRDNIDDETLLKRVSFIDLSGIEQLSIEVNPDNQFAYLGVGGRDLSDDPSVVMGLTLAQGFRQIYPLVPRKLKPNKKVQLTIEMNLVSPVFAEQRRIGVLIAELTVSPLLYDIESRSVFLGHQVHVVNEEGFFALAAEKALEWGHIIENREHFNLKELDERFWNYVQEYDRGIYSQGIVHRSFRRARHMSEDAQLSTLPNNRTTLFYYVYTDEDIHQALTREYRKLDRLTLALMLMSIFAVLFYVSIARWRWLSKRYLRLTSALLYAPLGTAVINAKGIVKGHNQAFLELIDKSEKPRSFVGRDIHQLGLRAVGSEQDSTDLVADLQPGINKMSMRDVNACTIQVNVFVVTLCDELNRVTHAVMHFRDVSEIVDVQSERKLLATVFESNVGMGIADGAGLCLRANPALLALCRQDLLNLTGKPILQIFDGAEPESEVAKVTRCLANRQAYQGELWLRQASATEQGLAISLTLTPVADENGSHGQLVFTLLDITHRKALEHKLKQMASTDAMTGLLNRGAFETILKKQLQLEKRYKNGASVILYDIDHFKKVNDKWGHDVGDQVIIGLSEQVKNLLRESDYLCRWGGEEFMVLLPHTELQNAKNLSERLRQKVENWSGPCQVTCSFGLTCISESDDFSSLFKRVDKALYEAKNTGRNKVVTLE